MKKTTLYVFVAVFVVALLLAFAWQANAQATRIEGLELYEYDCGDPQTFNPTFSGGSPEAPNVMHLRDYLHVNVVESDSPYLAGINTTVAAAEINFWSGTVSIRGTSRLVPTAYPDGAWVGRWVFIGSKGTGFGRAVYQGTGELKGMTMFLDLYDWFDFEQDDADAACASVSTEERPLYPEEGHTFGEATIVVSGRS